MQPVVIRQQNCKVYLSLSSKSVSYSNPSSVFKISKISLYNSVDITWKRSMEAIETEPNFCDSNNDETKNK